MLRNKMFASIFVVVLFSSSFCKNFSHSFTSFFVIIIIFFAVVFFFFLLTMDKEKQMKFSASPLLIHGELSDVNGGKVYLSLSRIPEGWQPRIRQLSERCWMWNYFIEQYFSLLPLDGKVCTHSIFFGKFVELFIFRFHNIVLRCFNNHQTHPGARSESFIHETLPSMQISIEMKFLIKWWVGKVLHNEDSVSWWKFELDIFLLHHQTSSTLVRWKRKVRSEVNKKSMKFL